MNDLAIEQTNNSIPNDLLLLSDPSTDVINEYIQQSIKFVAVLDTQIIGALLLLKTRPRTMEIMNISVYENHQNKGVGKKLINKAIDYAKSNAIDTLEIGTGNPGAIQMLLYQKCGFRIIGVDLDYFRRNHKEKIYENGIECRDMIRMRLDLQHLDSEYDQRL